MKKKGSGIHLNSDQIMIAMVDISDLDDAGKRHLSACTTCRRRLNDVVKGYSTLGKKARRFVPDTQKAPVMKGHTPIIHPLKRWGFKPAIGWCAAAAIVLMVSIYPVFHKDETILSTSKPVPDIGIDIALMNDIESLVEDVLPVVYQQIVPVQGTDSGEDFINFIVPAIEDVDSV